MKLKERETENCIMCCLLVTWKQKVIAKFGSLYSEGREGSLGTNCTKITENRSI